MCCSWCEAEGLRVPKGRGEACPVLAGRWVAGVDTGVRRGQRGQVWTQGSGRNTGVRWGPRGQVGTQRPVCMQGLGVDIAAGVDLEVRCPVRSVAAAVLPLALLGDGVSRTSWGSAWRGDEARPRSPRHRSWQWLVRVFITGTGAVRQGHMLPSEVHAAWGLCVLSAL